MRTILILGVAPFTLAFILSWLVGMRRILLGTVPAVVIITILAGIFFPELDIVFGWYLIASMFALPAYIIGLLVGEWLYKPSHGAKEDIFRRKNPPL